MIKKGCEFAMKIDGDFRFKKIRDVYLNRNGDIIGSIMIWLVKERPIVYLSERTAEHYFRKIGKSGGFGIDSAWFKKMIMNEKVEYIIIRYLGMNGLRYFVATIDAWIDNSEERAYPKEFTNWAETYGVQKFLGKEFMKEFLVMGIQPRKVYRDGYDYYYDKKFEPWEVENEQK